MLSTGAFNALLKTLEEPPENVMFILATTEPQKLPATILSRCLRLDFKRVPQALLMEGMRRICAEKGVSLTDSALKLLANCADGSVRDGLSVLDQVLASGQKQIDRQRRAGIYRRGRRGLFHRADRSDRAAQGAGSPAAVRSGAGRRQGRAQPDEGLDGALPQPDDH